MEGKRRRWPDAQFEETGAWREASDRADEWLPGRAVVVVLLRVVE